MTMAEPASRTGKTPLKKQPEIEEVEEGEGETDGSPNSDKSDTTITAGNDTPVAQSATGSPDSEGGEATMMQSTEEVSAQHPEHKPVRTNSQSKMKTLQRAVAVEDMSPPPVTYTSDDSESMVQSEAKLEKAGSESSEAGTSMSLSRESSFDTQYKDSTGIDLEEFIKKTLHKSVKDRKMILQLARDLKKFIKEPKHQFLQFAEMSSYDRMLVHRIAAFFGLDHNVDQSGKAVIVSKTQITRIPDFSFEDHIQKAVDMSAKKKILPRRAPSLEERGSKGSEKHPNLINNRAKSLEERQKSYDEAKARIFKNGEGGSEDFLTCTPMLSVSRSGKSSLVSSKEDLASSRQHSTDSSGYGSSENTGKQARLCTAKANSYGGFSVQHTLKYQGPASMSKADSLGSGGSFDCGSGRPYPVPTSPPGSQSDYSPLSRSSSTGPVPSPQTSTSGGAQGQNSPYAFLVAMDPTNIPPGSMIVNPQTLQPHVNPDGSLYRYDPAQPPPWLPNMGSSPHPSTPTSVSFPSSIPAQYSNEHDVISRLSNFSISQSTDIIESQQPGLGPGPLPQLPQGPHIVMSSQQPYPSQAPYLQQTYFPGTQGVTGQPVRYHYQVPYQVQSQGAVEGQPQSHSASVPHIGQFSQPYVQGYPASNYPNVMVQPSVSQSADMTGSNNVSQPGLYSTSHQESTIPTYSIQYGPYSQPQNNYGQPGQSPVFYSVSSTNPHLGYSFTGPTGSSIRPTTPPSQGNSVPNPSIAINMASQPMNFQQQGGSGTSGGHTTATSPQYGTYPVYPQIHQQAATAIRPVNQVVQIPGLQSHMSSGPSLQQPYSIVRPSMQMSLSAAGSMAPQGAAGSSIGQHAVGFKGYSVSTCFQKPSMVGDTNKEGGPSPAIMPANLGHITGSSVRPQQLGAGDLRMLGPTFRPQLQPLQFGQRGTSQQPPTPQHPSKPRE